MSEPPKNAKDIFLAALDVEPAERAALLDELCAGDAELRRHVEALLRVHDDPDSFLDSPRIDLGLSDNPGNPNGGATIDQPIAEKPGTVIGPYKLLQKIGEGGFGVVYMADQTEPVERRVALKIIKPGMDTRQVSARFEVERQALAMMDHPNIARVLDAGTTDSGRPYFVMELVKGVPITQFCDEKHLTPRERLELFVPVCQAIQHAHQKGVIHRDIKPTNVLMGEYDDRAVPKIIDFGVAKAIEQRRTERTAFTQLGQVVGTLEYMSPEQAKLNELDVDTRSDIYSLGVLLYELLSGETPFDRERLRAAAFDELLRIIREEEPPRPSLRLSSSHLLASIAANRHTEPKKLSALVRGELDWIVMKALEKDRTRRYETANGFAADIQRYLADEPVEACPPSAAYRFKKFARRNKITLTTTSAILLCLIAGIITTSWQAIRATKAMERAVEAEKTARIEADRANTESVRANQEAENAKTEKAAAEAERLRAESNLRLAINAQMNLGAEYLGKGDVTWLKRMLKSVNSVDQLAELRGFEWYYYDALVAPFVQIVNQGDMVSDVAVSRKGDLLAAIGVNDRSIRVWDAKTGEPVRTLSLEVGRFRTIAFSPDNNLLLSGSSDGMILIWNPAKDDRPVQQMKHGPPVAMIRFSPDGKLLLSSGDSGAVRLWDGSAETLVAEIPAGKSGVKDVRFSPDGKRIAVAAQDGRIQLWDVGSETIVGELPPERFVEAIAFSDDGQTIATGSYSGDVRIWSISDASLRYTHKTNSGRIGDLEFVKGTRLLAVLASDGLLHLYDTTKQQEIRSLNTHNLSGGVLAASADGEFLVVGSGDGSIKLLRVSGLLKPNVFWHESHVRGVEFLSGGKRIVAASGDGALRIWNIDSGESQSLADAIGQEILTISVQRRGNLIASAGVAPCVTLWDKESQKVIGEIDVPQGGVAVVAFSSSGRQLAVVTRLGEIFLYESEDWTKPRLEIAKRDVSVHALAFSPDDRDIAVAYEDGEIHFVDAANATRRDQSVHVSAIPLALAFCESGNLLAIGTDAGEICLYDLPSQCMRSIIKGHNSRINALATLPGGTTLVSGGRDSELRLWDTASGKLLTKLFGHRRQVLSISVSPDGETIASAGLEGDIRIWRTRPTD